MAELEIYDLMTICPMCDGSKKRPAPRQTGQTTESAEADCPHCQGRGVIATSTGEAVLEFLKQMGK